jgi:hypothetical protein
MPVRYDTLDGVGCIAGVNEPKETDMGTIEGTVWYRERLLLPPGAEVSITLEDVARWFIIGLAPWLHSPGCRQVNQDADSVFPSAATPGSLRLDLVRILHIRIQGSHNTAVFVLRQINGPLHGLGFDAVAEKREHELDVCLPFGVVLGLISLYGHLKPVNRRPLLLHDGYHIHGCTTGGPHQQHLHGSGAASAFMVVQHNRRAISRPRHKLQSIRPLQFCIYRHCLHLLY